MKAWVLGLWNDPAKFTAAVRALVFAVAMLMQQGAKLVRQLPPICPACRLNGCATSF